MLVLSVTGVPVTVSWSAPCLCPFLDSLDHSVHIAMCLCLLSCTLVFLLFLYISSSAEMCNLFVLRHVQFCCETTIWTWTGLNESFSERGYRGYFTNSVCNVEWEVQMENISDIFFTGSLHHKIKK